MTKYELFKRLLDLADNYYDEVLEAELNYHNGNARIVAVDQLENKKLTVEFRIEEIGGAE
jgi:hypothetical protein